jgi:hypothetical protein
VDCDPGASATLPGSLGSGGVVREQRRGLAQRVRAGGLVEVTRQPGRGLDVDDDTGL